MTNSLLPSPRENLSDKDSRAYILVSYSTIHYYYLNFLESIEGGGGREDGIRRLAAGENSECSFGGFILMM